MKTIKDQKSSTCTLHGDLSVSGQHSQDWYRDLVIAMTNTHNFIRQKPVVKRMRCSLGSFVTV